MKKKVGDDDDEERKKRRKTKQNKEGKEIIKGRKLDATIKKVTDEGRE